MAPVNHTVVDASGVSMSSKPMAGKIWPPSHLEGEEIGSNSSPLRSESASDTFPGLSGAKDSGNIVHGRNPFKRSVGLPNRSSQFYPSFPSSNGS